MKILIVVSYFIILVVFSAKAQYPESNAPQNRSNFTVTGINSTLSVYSNDTLQDPWDHLTINSDSRIKKLLEIRKEENLRKTGLNGKPGMDGFRIQIFQGTRVEAEKMRSKFLSKYPDIKTYLPFQTPDFRFRVGDFRDRSEAIRLQYLIEKDFPNTLIVEDIINFPELKKENDTKGEL